MEGSGLLMKIRMIFPITLLIFLILFTYSIADSTYEELLKNRVDINVDGNVLDTYDDIQQIDLPGFIYNNRTLLPLRKMFNIFGIVPEWNSRDRVITAEGNGKKIWLQIDNQDIKINDQIYKIDVPAKIFNNRAYVPVRFIAEAFGVEPIWDGNSKTVTLNLNNSFIIEEWSIEFNIPQIYTIKSHERIANNYYSIKLSSKDDEIKTSSLSNMQQEIKVYRFEEKAIDVIKSVTNILPITIGDFKEVYNLEEKQIYFAEYSSNKKVKSCVFVVEKDLFTYLFIFSNIDYATSKNIIEIPN